jgi:tRNA (guanosine-2'-O-)-methyltransferase
VEHAPVDIIDSVPGQRVVEILGPMMTEERKARIEAVLDARLGSVTAIVEDTYDPHNAAAAIRTIEALGVAELHVVEGEHERFAIPKGITRGCHRWIDVERHASVGASATELRRRGFRVYATLPGAAQTIDTVPVDAPIAIAFGNEHAGLSAEAIAACDGAVSIPMFGFTQSFNLSVSVGLVMARLAERRRGWLGATGDLDDDRKLALRARWYALKIRGAAEVVARVVGETRSVVAPETRPGDNPGSR